MKPKSNVTMKRGQKVKQLELEGPNWVLLAGGALLSTLAIRFGRKLKQAFETRRSNNSNSTTEGNGNSAVKMKSGVCQLYATLFCFSEDEDGCYQCLSGNQDSALDIMQAPTRPMSKEEEIFLPLVKISREEPNKHNGAVMGPSSPNCLEHHRKAHYYHSNCSDSPCISESSLDIYGKRVVIQKLRQQLKRRDKMIIEMQAQIAALQNSLTMQMNQSVHLQTLIDSANRDLFDSEREIQQLKKAITARCLAGLAGSLGKSSATKNWLLEGMSGQVNGARIF